MLPGRGGDAFRPGGWRVDCEMDKETRAERLDAVDGRAQRRAGLAVTPLTEVFGPDANDDRPVTPPLEPLLPSDLLGDRQRRVTEPDCEPAVARTNRRLGEVHLRRPDEAGDEQVRRVVVDVG